MTPLKNLLTVFAFSLLVLGLPSFASAQWRDRNDDYYGRNGSYGRNGGYNNGALSSTVRQLRNDSREFARRLDRELDHSRYDGSNREDNINRIAGDFRNAADRLENSFGNGRDMGNSYDEAQRVLYLGDQLERALSRTRLNYGLQGDWSRIRQELRTISNAYGYNNNNRNGNWGRGGNYPNNGRNNGDWRSRIPF